MMRQHFVLVLVAALAGWSGSSAEDAGAWSPMDSANQSAECYLLEDPSLCHQRGIQLLEGGDGGLADERRAWDLIHEACQRGFQPSCVKERFGAGMRRPKAIVPPAPKYSGIALEKKVSGMVVVKCTMTIDGYARNCRIVKSIPELDAEVLASMASARFEPVTFQGRPVQVEYIWNFNFRPP